MFGIGQLDTVLGRRRADTNTVNAVFISLNYTWLVFHDSTYYSTAKHGTLQIN